MGRALVLAFGAIIAAVLTRLLGDKLRSWMRWLTNRLLRIAIKRLPEAQRERFSEEWTSHINEVPGEISRIAVALGCISAARQMASLSKSSEPRVGYRVSKRFLDITGSLFALIFFLPVFVIIAIAVKLTSDGPIFFRQRRVGQYGNTFLFLKFRSMYTNYDAEVHKQYVKRLMAGKGDKHPADGNGGYKLTKGRITRVGAFLRKTSLDELPQFLNVLKGEMSLVGPRPPIPFEVEFYDDWHKLRFLAKPGITGLWQVSARSRVKFDEMVRLDLSYILHASILLDLKILLRTPGASLKAAGSTDREVRQTSTARHVETKSALHNVPKERVELPVVNESPSMPLRVGAHVKVGPTRPDGKPHPHTGKTGRITKFAYTFSESFAPSAMIKLDPWIKPQGFIWISNECLEVLPEDSRSSDL